MSNNMRNNELNPRKIAMKDFFNKNSALQLANAIKAKFFINSFQGFCQLFRNS